MISGWWELILALLPLIGALALARWLWRFLVGEEDKAAGSAKQQGKGSGQAAQQQGRGTAGASTIGDALMGLGAGAGAFVGGALGGVGRLVGELSTSRSGVMNPHRPMPRMPRAGGTWSQAARHVAGAAWQRWQARQEARAWERWHSRAPAYGWTVSDPRAAQAVADALLLAGVRHEWAQGPEGWTVVVVAEDIGLAGEALDTAGLAFQEYGQPLEPEQGPIVEILDQDRGGWLALPAPVEGTDHVAE